MRTGLTAAVAAAAASLSFAIIAPPASASPLFDETFHDGTVRTTENWEVSSPKGDDTPCLTSATTPPADTTSRITACIGGPKDPVGQGVFRLTDDTVNEAGTILLDKAVSADRGLTIEFDIYMWGGKPYKDALGSRTADGISFYLVDGATEDVVAGDAGGALGYKGLTGAFLGIGFDQYGNFSNPRYAGKGGPAGCVNTVATCVKPNSVVIRGSQGADYAYVQGKQLTKPLDDPAGTSRAASKRHVLVGIGTDNKMTVLLRQTDNDQYETVVDQFDLDKIPGQGALPDTIKLGFAASTGAATAFHEISDLEVRTRDADLIVKASNSGPFTAGGTGSFFLDASANPEFGYLDYPTKVTYDIPAGLTPTAAAGEGWTCSTAGQQVTCTREDELAPGESFPQIKVDVAVAPTATGTLTANAAGIQVADDEDAEVDPSNNKASTAVEIKPAPIVGPDLSTVVSGDKTVPAGGTGTVTLTTSNAPAAGPTTDTVTETFTAPAGTTVTGAEGDGWTCTVAATVTCTRPGSGEDALKPGASYPPINIGLSAPANAPEGPAEGSADTKTPGDTDPANDTTPVPMTITPAAVVEPDQGNLDVTINSNPNPYVAGKPYTYTVTVTNNGDTDVKGAKVTADWPTPWDKVKWTCTSAGGACPAASGTGDLNELIDLAKGGKMTFTVTCLMPASATASYTATATVTAADTNCDKGCTSTESNPPVLK